MGNELGSLLFLRLAGPKQTMPLLHQLKKTPMSEMEMLLKGAIGPIAKAVQASRQAQPATATNTNTGTTYYNCWLSTDFQLPKSLNYKNWTNENLGLQIQVMN